MKNYNNYYDVIIVGGGPSGMACAIELRRCEPSLDILLIEKNEELGKKLKATGSGRCNISNVNAAGYTECMEFLRRIGLALRVYDNGLVYPYSESASDVVNILRDRLREASVEIKCGTAVTKLGTEGESFCVESGSSVYYADNIVLATGGKAGPNYGTIGEGYRMASTFGHSIITTIPVLTSVQCDGQGCDKLGGIRARGRVRLIKSGMPVFEEDGEIQFTRLGLSGICIFNMTRFMRYRRAQGESIDQFTVELDLFAGGDAVAYMEDRRTEAALIGSEEKTETVLRGLLKPALADAVLKYSEVNTDEKIAYISDEAIAAVSKAIHALRFKPTSVSGWKDAQCTSGGVCLDELDALTCESLLQRGLYIIGELADYDGPCGGYNLTNAWITGLKAARGINESLQSKRN